MINGLKTTLQERQQKNPKKTTQQPKNKTLPHQLPQNSYFRLSLKSYNHQVALTPKFQVYRRQNKILISREAEDQSDLYNPVHKRGNASRIQITHTHLNYFQEPETGLTKPGEQLCYVKLTPNSRVSFHREMLSVFIPMRKKVLLIEGSEASSHKEAATQLAMPSDRKLSFLSSARSLPLLYRLKFTLLAP